MYTKENYVLKPYIYGNKFLEDKHKKLDDYFYEVQVEKDNNSLKKKLVHQEETIQANINKRMKLIIRLNKILNHY